MNASLMEVLAVVIFLLLLFGAYNLLFNKNITNQRVLNIALIITFGAGVILLVMAVLPFGNFYGPVQTELAVGDRKVVALTFDDGPYPPYTQELLKVLAEEGVQATFFMVGANAAKYPDVVLQVAQAGHKIGVHTVNHIDLLKLDAKHREYQIVAGKAVLQAITGVEPKLFRPPHGFRDWQVLSIADKAGLKTVNWSVLSKDWLNPTPEEIARCTLDKVQPGSIILLHDGDSPYNQAPRANTVQAVRTIIKELKAQGYEFVVVQ